MTEKNGEGPRPLIAGNWKMNGGRVAGVSLAGDLSARLQAAKSAPCEILVCPPAPLLFPVGEALSNAGIALGAQDCHTEPSGAHTGDVSPAMLVDAGCTEALNCNGDGGADLADVSFAFNFLFLGGPPPPAPFDACGADLAAVCVTHDSCAASP